MTVFMGGFALGVLMRYWLDRRRHKYEPLPAWLLPPVTHGVYFTIEGQPISAFFPNTYVAFEVDD